MGALILLSGIIILDVFAIIDVVRSRGRNVLLFVLLIIVLQIIGVSIWYFKKSSFQDTNEPYPCAIL